MNTIKALLLYEPERKLHEFGYFILEENAPE